VRERRGRPVPGRRGPSGDGSGGPAAAAGQPSAACGPHAALSGTEPPSRDRPKGESAQVARALITMAHASSAQAEESG
jgi:hypothetical protein